MTDAELRHWVKVVDKRKQRGGDHKSEGFQKSKGSVEPIDSKPSAETTAEIVGTSASKVKKIRYIEDHADDETKEAVKAGEMSIKPGPYPYPSPEGDRLKYGKSGDYFWLDRGGAFR